MAAELNRRCRGRASTWMKLDLRPCAWLLDHKPLAPIAIHMMDSAAVDKLCGQFLLLRIDENPNSIAIGQCELLRKT